MPRYLVESYAADSSLSHAEACAHAQRLAAVGGFRYVRTTFLPSDEVVLHLFEAPSLAAVQRAGERAALTYDRIVEAVEGVARDGSADA